MIEYTSTEVDDVIARVKSPNPQVVVTDVVQMAFTNGVSSPGVSTVFYPARWDTTASVPTALCTIGPGHVVLAQGLWKVWVKISDNPTTPVKPAGVIKVV